MLCCCQEYSRTLHPSPSHITHTDTHITQVLAAGTVIPLLSHCKNIGTTLCEGNRSILNPHTFVHD